MATYQQTLDQVKNKLLICLIADWCNMPNPFNKDDI